MGVTYTQCSGCGYVAVILGIITMVQVSRGMNSWPLYGIVRWLFYRGSFTMEVYVSAVRTRALAVIKQMAVVQGGR